MSLNLSDSLQKHTPRQSSTITNQIVLNGQAPSSSPPPQTLTSEGSIISNPYPSLSSPSLSSLPCPSLSLPGLTPSAPPADDKIKTEEKITKFKLILVDILQNLFQNEFSLLQNIIEPSKSIILKVEDLYNLICVLCDTQQVDIISSPIVKGCSCSEKLLYAQIDRIVVNGYDLMIAYNSAFNTLRSNHISLDHVIPSSCAF
jgi:hypothetical protein